MLEQLAQYHKVWISFVSKFCSDRDFIEDIVQEMYLKAHRTTSKKILIEGNVNKREVFWMLRNLCIDYHRAKAGIYKVELSDNYERVTEPETIDKINEHHERHLRIRKKLNEFDWYYEQLYLAYTAAENPSYRYLAEWCDVSLGTISNDMKKVQKIIRETA